MAKWKVMKSIHQFTEHENDQKNFLEGSLFVTTSKRDGALYDDMTDKEEKLIKKFRPPSLCPYHCRSLLGITP